LWSGVLVLAEVTDAVIALVRENEDAWLADLRQRLEPAREKRREAERLVQEAKAEEWRLHGMGNWLQVTSQDGPLGRQPAPTLDQEIPERFSADVLRSSLERPWHRQRPWKEGEGEEALRSWQEISEERRERDRDQVDVRVDAGDGDDADRGVGADELGPGDPTGVVSELDEDAAA
jgi:hypothetical protein